MSAFLEISSLYKQYPHICAVDKVSFQADKGEIIALLGPNGAGKSTLMNMIAGLTVPSGGSISIGGHSLLNDTFNAKLLIGFLAEGAPLYGDMTTKTFLSYMADLKGLTALQKQKRLEEVKNLAQIESVWLQKIESLSKGYQRRVGFAQSILSDPELLLLDEPTDGLDPNQKEHIRRQIKMLGKNKVVLISTHLLDDVEAMCNRIIVIHKGAIIADGTKQDILRKAKAFSLETAFQHLTGGDHA